jgi:3-hydroxyisobutyrate dehydrogenase-like beta-hydroxyacid dehydrogenase
MNIGFIGLGTMGSGMAGNILKAGHQLTVNDIRKETAKSLVDAGAIWADTPKSVAQASEVVLTSLPGPAEVEAAAMGKDGIIDGIRPGAVLIDLTSNSVATVRKIYDMFKEKGAHVIDAPVSGGPSGAKTGKLALMVGGDEEVFMKYKPILDILGNKVTYTGGIGNGSICKQMNNSVIYSLLTSVAECWTLGVKAGVSPKALWQVLRDGAVGSGLLFNITLPQTYLRGKFEPPNFALKLAFKDVGLGTALGREYSVPMTVANAAYQDMMVAMNRGWGNKDSRCIMLLQEERAGNIKVRIPEKELDEELGKQH